jgi:hypothetical protein
MHHHSKVSNSFQITLFPSRVVKFYSLALALNHEGCYLALLDGD